MFKLHYLDLSEATLTDFIQQKLQDTSTKSDPNTPLSTICFKFVRQKATQIDVTYSKPFFIRYKDYRDSETQTQTTTTTYATLLKMTVDTKLGNKTNLSDQLPINKL